MIKRLNITLEEEEYSALLEYAEEELRPPPEQVRYFIREALSSIANLAKEGEK